VTGRASLHLYFGAASPARLAAAGRHPEPPSMVGDGCHHLPMITSTPNSTLLSQPTHPSVALQHPAAHPLHCGMLPVGRPTAGVSRAARTGITVTPDSKGFLNWNGPRFQFYWTSLGDSNFDHKDHYPKLARYNL
jgi:hypothetical protein